MGREESTEGADWSKTMTKDKARRAAGIRNLQAPLYGPRKIASFISATARSIDLVTEMHELNGQPALVFYHEDAPFAALLLAVTEDRIHRVFFHADLQRLRLSGPPAGRMGYRAEA
jgi:hypothetical protein